MSDFYQHSSGFHVSRNLEEPLRCQGEWYGTRVIRQNHRLIAAIMILVHAGMVAYISATNSPNPDEIAHLPAGISHWQYGQFDLYRVNPHLVRCIAAAPVLLMDPELDWSAWNPHPVYGRPEFQVGIDFVEANRHCVFRLFTVARLACLPICLLGGWICYRWSLDLYGPFGAIISTCLWCFCPNTLAWSASITPDAVASSLCLWASYCFWLWLKSASYGSACIAGIALGAAVLSKTTLIILFPVWAVVVLLSMLFWKQYLVHRSRGTILKQFAVLLTVSLYVINLAYCFDGTMKPLKDYRFVSVFLSGATETRRGDNRFDESPLGHVRVPFPEQFILGIDRQRLDFEKGKRSYLRGEFRHGGWWYYYLYALGVKMPVGALLIIGLASARHLVRMRRPRPEIRLAEYIIVITCCTFLIVVSAHTGFSRHLRYVLPLLPLFYVASGSLGESLHTDRRNRWIMPVIISSGLLASTASTVSVFPHVMSYFNCMVGGPSNGPAHLLDANVDWGQDLIHLSRWYEAHGHGRRLCIAYWGGEYLDPDVAGLNHTRPPLHPPGTNPADVLSPGLYAISVNYLYGYDGREGVSFEYFRNLEAVSRVGYSINIYDIPERY